MTEEVASGVRSLADDFTDLIGAGDAAGRWAVLVSAFSRHGLDKLAYGFADVESFRRARLHSGLSMTTMNAEMIARYFSQDYHLQDPLIQYLRAGHLAPLPFDISTLRTPPPALTDISASGVTHGVLIPLPAMVGCPGAGLIAGSSLSPEQTTVVLAAETPRLAALTHLFHSRVMGEMMRRRDGASSLTPRERSCLQSISRGDRVAAVAHGLGLAEATVELHLRNARRKLRARSLPEAVARALLYREIEAT